MPQCHLQLCSRPTIVVSPPFFGLPPVVHTDLTLPHFYAFLITYPSLKLQQAFPGLKACLAKEAGSVTAEYHLALMSFKFDLHASTPTLCQTTCCELGHFLLSYQQSLPEKK